MKVCLCIFTASKNEPPHLKNISRLLVVILGVEVDDHVGLGADDVLQHGRVHLLDLPRNGEAVLVQDPVQKGAFVRLRNSKKPV